MIEGINLVAFEIRKDVLSDLAADRALPATGDIGSAFVIATIVQGVASLPLEASYLELGPVLDLDYLDWRSKRPVARDATVLTLSRAGALAVRTTLTAKNVDTDEPKKLVQSFQPKRNPRIEHTILTAFDALLGTSRQVSIEIDGTQFKFDNSVSLPESEARVLSLAWRNLRNSEDQSELRYFHPHVLPLLSRALARLLINPTLVDRRLHA